MNASFFVQPPEGHAALYKFRRGDDSTSYADVYAFTDRALENKLYGDIFDTDVLPEYLFDGNPTVISWVRLSIADEVRLYYGKLVPGTRAQIAYDTPGQLPVVTTAHDTSNLVAAEVSKMYPTLCGTYIEIGDSHYTYNSHKVATGSGAICHINGVGCRCIVPYALCGNAADKVFATTEKFNSSEILCALLWGPYKPEDLPASEAELTAEVMLATQLP